MRVLLFLRSSINQTWVCGCLLGFEFFHRFTVCRVGNDFGELLDLLELTQFRLFFFGNSSAHNLPPGYGFRGQFSPYASRCLSTISITMGAPVMATVSQKAKQAIENRQGVRRT